MSVNGSLDIAHIVAYLLVKDERILDVSEKVCNMVKFSSEEIIGKSIEEIAELLRCNFDLKGFVFDNSKSYFIFDRALQPIEVTIRTETIRENEVVYFISEVPGAKVEEKMPLAKHLLMDEGVGVAIFSVPDITLLEVNQTWLNFLDAPYNLREASIGRRISEFITGWEGSTSENIWKTFLETGEPLHLGEYRYDRFERGMTYWDANLIPIYEDGRMKYAVEMTKDITEKVVQARKEEEQARVIQQQKRKLEAVLESISDTVSIVDKHGHYIQSDETFLKLLKVEKIDNIKELYEAGDFYDFEDKRLSLEEMPSSRVTRGEKFRNYKLKVIMAGQVSYFSVNGTPIFDENGELEQGVLINYNITEDVLKANIIVEQKEKLEIIIENSIDGQVVFDKDMNATVLNEAARRFFYEPDNLKRLGDSQADTSYYDIEGNLISFENLPAFRALRGEKVTAMRVIARRPDGDLPVSTTASPIYDSNKELVGALLSIRYLDEAIRIEEMLKEQKEELERVLRMKEEFFSFISHEFKTPLTVMSSIIQVLNLVYKEQIPQKAMGYINKLQQSTLQQIRLVNNLLDITRGDSGYLKLNKRNADIVSMTKSIADSVSSFALSKDIRLNVHTGLTELVTGIDDEKYERIMLNLLSNAIKFTPEGKSINIGIEYENKKVLISVKDEGVGIPEDKLGVIFEKFGQVNSCLTRQGEGTGIGLCLVKALVKALGGEIYVKSRIGAGSTFIVALPVNKVQEETVVMGDLLENRLVQNMNVEFSNIYL